MNSESHGGRRRWFEEYFGQEAFLILSNLLTFNVLSRRLLADAEYNAVYRPLADRKGDLAAVPDDQRRALLDAITLDLLAKVMASIEDLGRSS